MSLVKVLGANENENFLKWKSSILSSNFVLYPGQSFSNFPSYAVFTVWLWGSKGGEQLTSFSKLETWVTVQAPGSWTSHYPFEFGFLTSNRDNTSTSQGKQLKSVFWTVKPCFFKYSLHPEQQHWNNLQCIRNAESKATFWTYGTRICILIRSPGNSQAH